MMIHTLAVAAFLTAPIVAMAAGNNLTMTGATYDTTGMIIGTGALNGGYATTPAGACYNSPFLTGPFPNTTYIYPTITFEKDVWVKAPTTLPTSPEVIFGDGPATIGENTAGYPTFQTGATFESGTFYYIGSQAFNETIADGTWHRLTMMVVQPGTAGWAHVVPYLDGKVLKNGAFNANSPSIVYPNPMPPNVVDPGSVTSIVTSIRGGAFTSSSGAAVPTFAGEIDSASCFVAPLLLPPLPSSLMQPYVGTETGLLGLWAFDGNGNDNASYLPQAAGTPYALYAGPPLAPVPYVGPPTPPSGGFPLSP